MPDEPTADLPTMFGQTMGADPMPWAWAEARLVEAENYWICTTRPDGRPHARPVWAVWLDQRLAFSTGSLAAANLARSPEISVHLESGEEVVIVEGTATELADPARVRAIVAIYNDKYRWDLDPDALPGPFYDVIPRVAFGWRANSWGDRGPGDLQTTATRWRWP
jgi:Pyridoxamine 5'-phosphate oxidase